MTTEEKAAYLGVYQAYAWEQGFRESPISFRIPDEHFVKSENGPDGFVVSEFMEAVADLDDGHIHLWKYYTTDNHLHPELKPNRHLALICTEDDSMARIAPDDQDNWHYAEDTYWQEAHHG